MMNTKEQPGKINRIQLVTSDKKLYFISRDAWNRLSRLEKKELHERDLKIVFIKKVVLNNG